MSVTKVRAQFSALQQIAQTFNTQAEQTQQMRSTLSAKMAVLANGHWVGQAANRFYAEMNGSVLPAIQRLHKALEEGGRVTQQISRLIEQTDAEAARLFRAEFGGGALGGASSGTPAFATSGLTNRVASPAPSGAPTETPGFSAYPSKGDSAGNGVVGRMLKNLSPEVRELAAKSPTLLKNLEIAEKLKYKVVWGSVGGGTGASGGNKGGVIEIEPGFDVKTQVDFLAHETAHVAHGEHVAINPTDLPVSKADWVKTQTDIDLDGEGNSVMMEGVVRDEILKAGGPDIGMAFSAKAHDQYVQIYQDYKNGQEVWESAQRRMGQLYGLDHPSGTPLGTTYRDYYAQGWNEFWDKHVAPAREGRD